MRDFYGIKCCFLVNLTSLLSPERSMLNECLSKPLDSMQHVRLI